MSKKDFYCGLNKDSKLRVEIDIPQLVVMVNSLNYGTHRFLSALVDELREKQEKFNAEMNAKYKDRLDEKSELAEGINELLQKGYFK